MKNGNPRRVNRIPSQSLDLLFCNAADDHVEMFYFMFHFSLENFQSN